MISPVINTDLEIDKEISQLLSRVECYESSIEQLHKEIPKYLENHSNTSKETLAFSKVLRNVASLETNVNVQSIIFLYAQKCENLESEKKIYSKCQDSMSRLLDVSKSNIVSPMKDVIMDIRSLKKKKEKLALQSHQSKSRTFFSSSNTFNEDLDKHLKLDVYTTESYNIHRDLFEQHRVRSLKKVLAMLLYTELRYHSRVMEELSEVLIGLELLDK